MEVRDCRKYQEIRRGEREADESDLEKMRFVSRQSNSILAVDEKIVARL